MEASSIITQVHRDSDPVTVGFQPAMMGSNMTTATTTTTTGSPSSGATNNGATVNNNVASSGSLTTTTSTICTSGHKNKSRHKSFMDTMDSLFCCFRRTWRFRRSNRSTDASGMTNLPIGHSDLTDGPDDYFSSSQKLHGKCLLPALKGTDPYSNQMCLVIDLDETLVHSSFKPISNPDFIVPVEIDGTIHQVYVLKRPYVDEFLQKVGQLYECVLFTASLAKYADPVADLLDKWGVFKARLFRESCVFYRGNYVKDLGRLGRDLHKVVIVDNSPASYIFHPDNAVPVASWFDNVHDTELRDLIPFFEKLSKVENIYTVLRNANHATSGASNNSTSTGNISPTNSIVAASAATASSPLPPNPSAIVNSITLQQLVLQQQQQQQQQQQSGTPQQQRQSFPLQQLKSNASSSSSSPSPSQMQAPATPGSVIHSSTTPASHHLMTTSSSLSSSTPSPSPQPPSHPSTPSLLIQQPMA